MILSRRRLLKAAGAFAVGLAVGGGGCVPGRGPRWTGEDEGLISRAEDATNLDQLREGLERIEAWLKLNAPEADAALSPPLGAEELRRRLEPFPYPISEEMSALYQWRNGSKNRSNTPFIYYHDFMSVDRAIEEYRSLNRTGFITGWSGSWFPIFDFQGEYYFAACSPTKRKALPIRFYFNEDPETKVAYVNLTTMILTAADVYESGAVERGPNGGLVERDIRRIRDIHQGRNPGIAFPYAVPDA